MTTTFEIPQVLDEIDEEISATEEVGQEAGEIIDGEFEVEDDESQFNDDDELQMLDENGNEIIDEPASEPESANGGTPGENLPEPAKPMSAEIDYADRVERANGTFIRAALYRAKAEAEAKFAKAQEKAALEELQAIIERGPEHMPLFDGVAAKADKATEEAESDWKDDDIICPVEPAIETTADKDESWREVEVGELDLPSGIVNSLIGANLETIGQLADFSSSDCELTEIEGIGKAKAEKIENALEQFWAKRNENQSV